MIDFIVTFFRGLPPELSTVIIAAMPLVEIRLSIPVAIELFNLPVWQASTLSFVGSVVPAVLLPIILEPLEKPCREHIPYCDRMFTWVIGHVEKRYTEKYQVLGALGLVLFIAIPLPMTGVWTGALAAWVFRIKKRVAIPAIVLGTGLSTVVVTLTTLGIFGALRFAL